MRFVAPGLAALLLTTGAAHAGGIERSLLPYGILFEDGRVAVLSFSSVMPNVSGSLGGLETGNMAQDYVRLAFAVKADLSDKLAFMVSFNQPYGADALYTAGAYTGLEAHWESTQVAALLKYQLGDRVSVYGGLRYVTSSAEIFIPAQMLGPLGAYTATTENDSQVGYLVGAAYEIPDIMLRVGLTYESAITHELATSESFTGVGAGPVSTTEIIMPQSVALDFQSGIAKDTLLFGSVRWTEWSKWHVSPALYFGTLGEEVTGFDSDVFSYQLGVGRRINDNFSVFARVGYEAATGDVASRLSPTDGMQSIGIGGSWSQNNIKVTGGVEYVKLGDAVDASGTVFSGNDALGLGLSVEFIF